MLVRGADARAVALECLARGRRRTTGQRVMVFLEAHKEQVLETRALVGNGQLAGREPGGKPLSVPHVRHRKNIKEFEDFTAQGIAKKLSVSREDVRSGIELLAARGGDRDRLLKGLDEAALEVARLGILAGKTPIRRWEAAARGKAVAQHGRVDVDWGCVLLRALLSLNAGFKHWKEIRADVRALIEEDWDKAQQAAPEQLR